MGIGGWGRSEEIGIFFGGRAGVDQPWVAPKVLIYSLLRAVWVIIPEMR